MDILLELIGDAGYVHMAGAPLTPLVSRVVVFWQSKCPAQAPQKAVWTVCVLHVHAMCLASGFVVLVLWICAARPY